MQFCNVGKAILIRSLGIQKNYKEILSDGHIVYNNEKNYFGYQPRLKRKSLLLLLYLHFLGPDKQGFICHVDLKKAAETLNCSKQTIKNNLSYLVKYGYILCSKDGSTICLTEYKNYYLDAKHGGRGYFVLSWKCFLELLKVSTIIELRILLRSMLFCDDKKDVGNGTVVKKSYREINRCVRYPLTKKQIRTTLEQNKMMIVKSGNNDIQICTKREFVGKLQKKNMIEKNMVQLQFFACDFNSRYHGNIKFTEAEKYNLSSLMLEYSEKEVYEALETIFLNYSYIKELGGLVRTVIRDNQ